MIRKNNLKKQTRGQVTIFIIIALVLVAGIVLFFLISSRAGPEISMPSFKEPEQYIEKCSKDASSEAISIMMPQGGWINATNYKLYEDNKIAYLCYTNVYYKSCLMQEPLYIKHLQDEIAEYIKPKLETCFANLKSELEKDNYRIELGEMNLTTELIENLAIVKIKRVFGMSKQDESRRFESFNAKLNSPIYNLAIVAQEIANQEAKNCYFEYQGFMILYPEFDIERKAIGSGTGTARIYIIEDKNTGKKLNLAIRSCAIPAGF